MSGCEGGRGGFEGVLGDLLEISFGISLLLSDFLEISCFSRDFLEISLFLVEISFRFLHFSKILGRFFCFIWWGISFRFLGDFLETFRGFPVMVGE